MGATTTNRPGQVRDAIIAYLQKQKDAHVTDIYEAVIRSLGRDVPASSIRSYLNLNVGSLFERVGRGRYRWKRQ